MTTNAIPTSADPSSVDYSSGVEAARYRSRLVFPIVLVAIYWIIYAIFRSVDLTTIVRFMSGLILLGLLTLMFFGWWLLGRGRGWAEKFGVLAVAVVAGIVSARLADGAIQWFSFVLTVLPRLITLWVLWLLIARGFSQRTRLMGLMAIIVITWGYHDLLRMRGLSAEQVAQMNWRWTPTPEQVFLAQRAIAPKSPPTTSATPVTLQPGDWANYLGIDRTGAVHGSAIRTDWVPNPPKMIWKTRAGPGWSSMIIVGNRLFTSEQLGEDEAVVCLDAATGAELWSHADRVRFEEPLGGAGPRATPTFANGRLYTLGAKGLLNCLDAATGSKIWSRHMPSDAGGAEVPMWAFCSSPLVMHDKVIVYSGKGLHAYDAATGAPLWTAPIGGISYGSAMPVKLLGVEQILMLTEAGLNSIDPADGKVLWVFAAPARGAPRAMNPHVIGDDSVLMASETDLGVARLKVARDPSGVWSASKVWSSKKLNAGYNQFVVLDGAIYGFDGSAFTCLDVATGNRKWRGERYGRGQVILLADQKLLLVLSETGEVVLLPAQSGAAPTELGRFQALNGKTWNHPILVKDKLYARNAEEIAAYELGAAPAR